MGTKIEPAVALPLILGNAFPLENYPESERASEIEQAVALTLPAISGLKGADTEEQRQLVLKEKVAKERAAFIATHGDPFGDILPCADAAKPVAVKQFVSA